MTEPTQSQLDAWYRDNWIRMAIMAVLVSGLVLIFVEALRGG